jgi:methylmalonyl-CoA mutase
MVAYPACLSCLPCPALQRLRAGRDETAVQAALAALEAAARSDSREQNLLALAVEAARLR